jgi:ribosome-binding factor A
LSDQNRMTRVSVEMQRELAEIIRSLKDPRIKGVVSVTSCDVTRDFRHAKVRISVYGVDELAAAECFAAIEAAKGYIRREIGSRMKLRYTPQMHFASDTSIEYGVHMARLLNELVPQENTEETNEE